MSATKICESCGTEFRHIRGLRQRFCRPECRRRYDQAQITGNPKACQTCGDVVIVDDDADDYIQGLAWKNHRRFCIQKVPTQPRGNTMSLQAVPEVTKRPPAVDLVKHHDKRIAKAAQKVIDAADNLDAVWNQYAEKAALRDKEAKLKAQLAEIQAQLRGTPTTTTTSAKEIRAWARANGYNVNPAGIIPKDIVDAYHNGGGAA